MEELTYKVLNEKVDDLINEFRYGLISRADLLAQFGGLLGYSYEKIYAAFEGRACEWE